MTRIVAPNKIDNLMHVLERMCWNDCKKGMSYSWIFKNIVQKYHITNNICRYMLAVGFLRKKGKLYFHTGLTPSKKIVEDIVNQRYNYQRTQDTNIVNTVIKPQQSRLELFEQMSNNFFTLTNEEKQFILAFRNLLKSK